MCPVTSDCRWSGPHTCLCVPALPATQLHHSTITHFTPRLKSVSASQVFTRLGLYDVKTAGAPLSDQNTHPVIRVLGHQAEISPLDLFNVRPVSEPTQLMCNVLLQYCAIGGLPSPYLLHASLDFSCCFTSITPPETPPPCTCMIRLHTVTLSGSTCGQENTTNRRISHNQMSREAPHIGFHSHPTIIPDCQSSH